LTIGRASDNRLVVNSPTASSHHAEIRSGVSGYSLTDLGSTNGTFVNEQPLASHLPRLLQGGDRIRIGDMVFLYEAGRPDFQRPFRQENSYKDVPTARVSAIEYRAISQSELFGDQPPAPYSSSTPQQQPISPALTPAFQQSNTSPWTMERANGYGMPEQLQPYAPPAPVQPKSSHRLKVLLIVLSVVLVLGVGGGGVVAYLLTRPQPVMSVTSTYQVGSTPAGSTGTVLHISARSFSCSTAS
jgi:predicted component of type VI protein secretion system